MVIVHDLTVGKWLNGVEGQKLSQNLRARSLKIYRHSSIYEQILGGAARFKCEIAYKLQMAEQ